MLYDCATALALGHRDVQQNSVSSDFQIGNPFGYIVLAEGRGPRAARDRAAKILVTELFSELKFQCADPADFEGNFTTVLTNAFDGANACLAEVAEEEPEIAPLAADVVVPVIFGHRLYWASSGQVSLCLFRDGEFRRLNMQPANGTPEVGHAGGGPEANGVSQIELSSDPVEVRSGDVVIATCGTVYALGPERLSAAIARGRRRPANELAALLLDEASHAEAKPAGNLALGVVKII